MPGRTEASRKEPRLEGVAARHLTHDYTIPHPSDGVVQSTARDEIAHSDPGKTPRPALPETDLGRGFRGARSAGLPNWYPETNHGPVLVGGGRAAAKVGDPLRHLEA